MLLLSFAFAAAPPPVVGGDPSPDGAWPDAAAIYFGRQVGCTGTLIAPDLVLTAGHCADGITSVKVGATDYTDNTGEQIDVAEIHEYPDSQRSYDVTLLVLERASTVTPRPIALDCVLDENLTDGAAVAIVGYGATDPRGTRYPTNLYEAYSTVGDADCSDLSTGCQRSVSPGGEVVAGGDGIDSCYGDSGGPLYLKVGADYYLVGVTSRGVNGSSDCGAGGIYVRPDAIVDWIESTSGETLQRPDCDPNHPPEPTAAAITVHVGEVGTTQVEANDPDADDHHTFTLVEDAAFGSVVLQSSGFLTYDANGGTGETEVTLTVTDDGDPVEAASVTIPITVTGDGGGTENGDDSGTGDTDGAGDGTRKGEGGEAGGCGCANGGSAPIGVGLLAVLGLLRRRSRQGLDQPT